MVAMSGTSRKSDKPWMHALRLAAMAREPGGERRLRLIAERCVKMAMAGDLGAIQEIGNRLDGKPAQASSLAVTHTHNLALSDGQLAELVERFERKMLEGTPAVEVDGDSTES